MGSVADCFDNAVAESPRRWRGRDHPAGGRGGRGHVLATEQLRLKRLQRVGVPLFNPAPLLRGGDAQHLKATPL